MSTFAIDADASAGLEVVEFSVGVFVEEVNFAMLSMFNGILGV